MCHLAFFYLAGLIPRSYAHYSLKCMGTASKRTLSGTQLIKKETKLKQQKKSPSALQRTTQPSS